MVSFPHSCNFHNNQNQTHCLEKNFSSITIIHPIILIIIIMMLFRCGCSPNDFLADDWTKLEGTKPRQLFFARKFEAIIHQGVVNKVEDWVEGEGTVPETSKNSYWQNLFHHEDAKPSMNTDVLAAMLALEVSTLSHCKISFSSLLEATTLAVDSNRDSNLLLLEAMDLSSSQTVQLEVQMR